MERDFMGLNAKESVTVNEEVAEGRYEDPDFVRSSGVQLPLTNTMPAVHNLMSVKPEQDEKPTKLKSDKQLLVNFQNCGGADMKLQFPGGNPFATSHSVPPSGGFLAGTTKQWINSKTSSTPAQLTIFYGGTISVFDDISPEKAQAIVFLAGSGCIPSSMAQSKLHLQASASKLPAADQVMVNQNMPPSSGLPSPMSVSSHPLNQSGVPAANNDVKVSSNTIGMATTLVSKVELPSMISSIGNMISSAIPQARRASLARFLEKRKERFMNAAPYKLSEMATDCTPPESTDFSFSANSGVGSNSASITRE